ncbi:MAG: discoidin domain-containing protein [Prevotella sp.]|nr:discoidin domain-containing protein [Prevotella sp.]
MKKITSLFVMLLMAVMTVGAQTVISIGASTGTFYNGATEAPVTSSNQYLNRWVSSTTPALTFSCRNGNMVVNNTLPTATQFNLHTDPSNYTLSYPDGKILSYTIKAYVTNAGSINGTDVSTDPDNPTEITVSDINATTATLVIAGTSNPWMYITEFTVTVEEPSKEQFEASQKANSWLEVMHGQTLVADASNYISNAKQSDEGTYAALLDNDNSTYFHSAWGGSAASMTGHDLQARLPEAVEKFHIYYVTRSTGTGYPTAFRIDGSNNAEDFSEAGGTGWTEGVGSLSGDLPEGATKAYMSDAIELADAYQYLRFVPTIGNNQDQNWFCLAEFWLLPSNEEFDAAIDYLKNPKSALDLTAEDIAKINQIDEALKSTTITVTYELWDNGSKVNSIEVLQGKNSAVNVPTDLTKGYSSMGYDFTTSGTIGTSDCTIEVSATPKEGVVTDLANLSNDKAYLLTTSRGTLGTNGTQMVSTNGTSYSASDFAIIYCEYDSNYYLWSIADSKWVKNQEQPALTTEVAEAGTLTFDPSGLDKPLFFMGMGTNGVNVAGGYGTGIVVNSWTTRDDGNKYVIKENGDFDSTEPIAALDAYFNPAYTITYVVKNANGETLFTSEPVGTTEGATITTLPAEFQRPAFYTYNEVSETLSSAETTIEFTATLKDDAVFQFTADTTEPVWYNLTIRPDNSADTAYPTFVEGGDPNVTLPGTLAEDETTQWAFIGEPYAGFQIVNKAAGTDLVLGSANAADDGNTGGNTYATLATPGSQTYELWTVTASSIAQGGFFINNAEGQYLNRRSNANLAYWTGGHDVGSTFTATIVPTDEELYNLLLALLETYEIGEDLNQYQFTGEYEGYGTQEIDNLKTEGYTPANLEAVKAMLESIALNMPEAGTFLRIFSVAQNGYVSSTEGQEVQPDLAGGTYAKFYTTTGTADEAATIWFFDGTHLLNYATGLYTKGVQAAEVGDESGDDITFSEATNGVGMYWIKPSSANYWFGGAPTVDRWSTPATNLNTRFTLEKVTELPITLTEVDGKYYATFSAPVDIEGIIGADLYKVTVDGDKAKYEDAEMTGVPANTGVLLIGTSEEATAFVGEYTDNVAETGLSAQISSVNDYDNLFFGLNDENAPAFVKTYSETGGFKAFISSSDAGSEEVLNLVDADDETNGIDAINNGQLTNDNSAIYNLQGQKVNKAQKGVFIQNGRKVVVK